MSFPLSSISTLSLSDNISDFDLDYVNTERGISILSAQELSVSYHFLSSVQDFAVIPEGMVFLTDFYKLSSLFQIDSLTFNLYSYDTPDVVKNINVDVLSSIPIASQYLIVSPNISETSINIIPLKNTMSIQGEYGDMNTMRTYDGIYLLPESRDIFLQYRSSVFPKQILPDATADIHLPDNISSFDISALKIIENGAYQGICPANSDQIFIDRTGYSLYTDSGFADKTTNGEPLCIWLSENSLYERWYDADNISQGDAYITQKNNNSYTSIIDTVTMAQLSARNKLTYHRLGPISNSSFVNSLSSNLKIHFDSWGETFSDTSSSVQGFVIESYNGTSDILSLDGTNHAHIPPTDDLHITENVTVGLWAYSDDWSKGVDTQLWGNFSNLEGYGLFYNTGATNELISFPTDNGFIYGFNFKGYKIFEKDVRSLSLSSPSFEYIVTDYFGARWLWDNNSNKIIKLESDDLVSLSISLPESTNIKKMQINSQNEIFILDQTTNTISAFDIRGQLFDTINVSSPYNNFDIRTDDTLIFNYSRLTEIDSDNNVYKILGTNLYKNETMWYHFHNNIQTIKIGSDDSVYVYSSSNVLVKLDTDGTKLFELNIPLNFTEDTVEIGFVKENKNNVDFDVLWVIFNSNKLILKIDESGRIIKRINLRDVVNLKGCDTFNLTTKGDFTGFDIKRKYELATSSDPAFSLKLNLKCGDNVKIVQVYVPAAHYRSGWVHLGFNLNIVDDNTHVNFYVNGKNQSQVILPSIYHIDYGTKVSPFIIGGNSGRLGAKNVERSLNKTGYFKGEIADIRIYDTALSGHEIQAISRNRFWDKWQPITLLVPTLPRTYLEKIERFHLNKYPGFKSNAYNLKISGIDNSSDQINVENFIRANIKKISPANTLLNEIVFL